MKLNITNLLLLLLSFFILGCAAPAKPKSDLERVIVINGHSVIQKYETDGWVNL